MNNNIFLSGPQDSSLFSQYQDFIQHHRPIDHYANLEKELQSLSDADITELSNYKPYNEANNALAMLIQSELLKLVRNEINKNAEAINNVIASIKEYKNQKQKEQNDFQDYIKNYSDLTYNDYIKLKNNI